MASDLSKLFTFVPRTGSEEHFKKLDSSLKEKVIAAATEYNNLTGKKLTINSAWRSREDQQRIKDNKKPDQTVAEPGTSSHEKGLAVDIQEASDPVLQKIMADLGVTHGYGNGKKNVTHFSVAKSEGGSLLSAKNGFDGEISGPESGYKPDIEMHGPEKVTITPAGDKTNEQMVSILQMIAGQNETIISLLDNGNDYTKKLVSVMS
jgi:hypothetical protein